MNSLIALTGFGDPAVLLPLALAIFLWLTFRTPREPAWAWLAAVVLCGGITAALKVFFFACPLVPGLRSPSGHASLSTLVYGGILVILAAPATGRQRWLLAIAGGLFILGIAVSRLILGAHSLAETLAGLAIGAAALAGFAWRWWRQPRTVAPLWPLLLPSALLLIGLHGHQLRAEAVWRTIGAYLRAEALVCG